MDFISFARTHGVLIDRIKEYGEIHRAPTVNKPKKKNASYWYDGTHGWVINWDDGGKDPQWWNDPSALPPTAEQRAEMRRRQLQRTNEIARERREAASKARSIIAGCTLENHWYLSAKGADKAHQIAGMKGLVTESGELIVPMRHALSGALVGCQRIYLDEGKRTKKFLFGTAADLAIHTLGNDHSRDKIYVEGYATGLSVKMAVERMSLDARVIICFSAGNLAYVADELPRERAFIVADHDGLSKHQIERGETVGVGQRTAAATGLPWCMPPVEGTDANDMHQSQGIMSVQAMVLKMVRGT